MDQSGVENSSMDQSNLSRSSFVLTTNSGTDKTNYSSQTATTIENLLPEDSIMHFDVEKEEKPKRVGKKKKKKGGRAKRVGKTKDNESEKAGGRRKAK